MFLPLRRKINYEIFVQMLLKGFLPSLCDVLYDSLAKSDLCLIGLFSCSANFITRFVIPSAGIIFFFAQQSFPFPRESHDSFSSFYLSWSVCFPSSLYYVSSERESRRFRNRVVPPTSFYPVCIQNPFLGGEFVFIFPYLTFFFFFHSPFILTRSI